MAESYLIDTSAVIKYLNGTFPENGLLLIDEIVDKKCSISFISEIELQVWNPSNPEDAVVYQSFIKGSEIIGLSPAIISETVRIRKECKVKLPDALIAATALTNGWVLIADNDKDFSRMNTRSDLY
ncbi:type II toxin-antitoxin system VapC family toxin [Larkinella terrae]|uniref:PIN domain-containing protein n=1 Tax=Larkinella terrae TaxID=2025311 RepID=A0A7K0ERQ8_9BACT|nr:type II toxin-antitoxin system VapC family toxin [Larkinella terrae]MRS64490.1 PIN domain-containing protein [Larkinella terrae]